MSNPATQLTFNLRTTPNVRTVHLLGSWDNYKSQLPLACLSTKDPDAKPGSWRGTFRFQGTHALKLGSRYWYYYIVDGYHVSHDPAKEYVTEKTTGRKLNVLNIPGGKGTSGSGGGTGERVRPIVQTSNLPGSRHSRDVPIGRALSPGKIQHPRPSKPYASRQIREADYETSPIDDLEERFAGTRISPGGVSAGSNRHSRHYNYMSSPSQLSDNSTSSGTTFSSMSPGGSSLSSLSCRCERYGVTRAGQRVKLDCGGKRCGYNSSSSGSDCSSEDSESSDDDRKRKRHGDASHRYAENRKSIGVGGGAGGKYDDRGGGRHDVGVERRRDSYVVERRPRR